MAWTTASGAERHALGLVLQLAAHRRQRAGLAVADGDDEALAGEQLDLGELDGLLLVVVAGGLEHEEQAVAVALQLRALVGRDRVLDGEGVELGTRRPRRRTRPWSARAARSTRTSRRRLRAASRASSTCELARAAVALGVDGAVDDHPPSVADRRGRVRRWGPVPRDAHALARGPGLGCLGAVAVGVDELPESRVAHVVQWQLAGPGGHRDRRVHLVERGGDELRLLGGELAEAVELVVGDVGAVRDPDGAVLQAVDDQLQGRDLGAVEAAGRRDGEVVAAGRREVVVVQRGLAVVVAGDRERDDALDALGCGALGGATAGGDALGAGRRGCAAGRLATAGVAPARAEGGDQKQGRGQREQSSRHGARPYWVGSTTHTTAPAPAPGATRSAPVSRTGASAR